MDQDMKSGCEKLTVRFFRLIIYFTIKMLYLFFTQQMAPLLYCYFVPKPWTSKRYCFILIESFSFSTTKKITDTVRAIKLQTNIRT